MGDGSTNENGGAQENSADKSQNGNANDSNNANTGNSSTASNANNASQNGSNDTQGLNFTQQQLNVMMTREKQQGRDSVYRALGIDSKNTALIDAVKNFVNTQKTDAQKAAEAESRNTEMEQRAALAEAKVEAMMAGIKPNYVEDAVMLALPKVTESNGIKAVFTELKAKYPIWFGEDAAAQNQSNDNNASANGTGTTVGASGSRNSNINRGARLAQQKKSNVKSSFWS